MINKTVWHMENGKLFHTTGTFESAEATQFEYWDKYSKRKCLASLDGFWFFLDRDECLKSAYTEEVEALEELRVELETLKEHLATTEAALPATLEEFIIKVTT